MADNEIGSERGPRQQPSGVTAAGDGGSVMKARRETTATVEREREREGERATGCYDIRARCGVLRSALGLVTSRERSGYRP